MFLIKTLYRLNKAIMEKSLIKIPCVNILKRSPKPKHKIQKLKYTLKFMLLKETSDYCFSKVNF